MALTLQDMREGASDKVAEQVVDTFLRESEILQMLPFDNTVGTQMYNALMALPTEPQHEREE